MQMYIEDVIFNSIIVDGVILFLTQYSLRIKFNFLKTFLSSVFGCFFSILISNYNFYPLVEIVLKICCGLIICVFMVQNFNFKNLFIYFLVFISFTFLLGGFSIAVLFLINGEVTNITNIYKTTPTIFSVLYIIFTAYILFLVSVIKGFYKKQKIEQYIYNLKIYYDKKIYNLKGYLDSGNFLKDSNSNLPIIVINLKTFFNLFKNINIVDVLSSNLNKKIQGQYINCLTVNGQDKIFVFKPTKIVVNNREINALLGFSYKFNIKNNNFDVLLSPLCV